jgi:hypothetical protein
VEVEAPCPAIDLSLLSLSLLSLLSCTAAPSGAETPDGRPP